MEDVAEPPNDLFDLILVDEAHHSRAKTWESLLNSFPAAKKVLFTATPFRRDQREIKGRLVYNYPVSLAVEDEIFGQIEYLPVEEIGDESDDIRIARQAEKIFREDRDNGLEHLLMVRTDSKKRAEELKKIYEANTTLNLQLVHSGHSYSHIKSVIKKLEENVLDGVICVDMLGEGFDLPQLKIAAIHSPHKSLAITLQFIGRFARTNTDKIGKAKFLAIPSTVKGILERLYIEGADWQKLVIELSETRIEEEVASREVIESFEESTQADPDFENTSLYSLRPFLHVKIFQLTEDVDLECDLPSGLQVVFRKPNHEKSMDLFIIKNTSKPKWASSDQFTGAEFHLFVVYFDVDTKLLFINSSYKNDLVYDATANSYSRTVPYSLSLDKVDKVLVDLENFDFFNIGMRSNLLKNNVESYRILTGSSTQKKINRLDGRYFNRGHLFGRANEGDKKVTIGYSSSSKVWSNRYEGISRLLFWCKQLAQKISSGKQVNTFSSLDFLSTGQSIDKTPKGVIALG